MSDKQRNTDRRVVVTGLGVVSSLGIGWEEFWKNLIAGKSGISKITAFDVSKHDRIYGGEIKNFEPKQFISKHKISKMGRSSQLAIAASKLALKDATLDSKILRNLRTGVCIGTTMGEPQILEIINNFKFYKGLKFIDPKQIFIYPANIIIINLTNELKLTGPNYLFANACSAGNYSIGYAFDCIRSSQSDIMLAGGVDSMTRLNLVGFNRLLAVAKEKCQPFDKNRQGMIVGEGAGMVVLENLESALKRKANIYAEILGYHLSCDGRHMTAPSENGVEACIKKALKQANVQPQQVDYISAHGTGTVMNDFVESKAINRVFNSVRQPPTSSIKSMLGHTMGAASALEAIVCCLTIKNKIVPPTINFETLDPECNVDCVPNKARKIDVNIAINNSFAFGGNNACLVLKSVDMISGD